MFEPFEVVTGQGLCNPGHVDQFVAACMHVNSTQTSCNDFVALMPDCANCLVASFDKPGIMPAASVVFDFILPSTYACEAVVQGKPACAQEVSDFVLCGYTACSECDQAGLSFVDCVDFASIDGICGTQLGVSDFCLSVLEGQSPACGGADFFEAFGNIGQLFCGAP